MLDPELANLADLALALEDHSRDHRWWLDPETGDVAPRFRSKLGEQAADEPATDAQILIQPLPSAIAYEDMRDFVKRVRDPRARHMLQQAMTGRGAFRRFKDTLLDYPELRRAWFAFHDARSERRAIRWLLEHRLVERASAEAALDRTPEPGPDDLPALVDAHGIAIRLARDLRRLYRNALEELVMFGPWARGDARADSPIELLVTLTRIADPWQEKRRMDRIVWRYSARHETVITVLPVTPADVAANATPLIARAKAEGVTIP
ncbi:MAG: UPF0158 family protein [Thermoleophilaceae bacterium]